MDEPLRVLFLCRGSAHDGIGHIIRSRTVARAMAAEAIVKLVAIGDGYVENLLSSSDVDYEIVSRDADALPVFRDFSPNVVVFDLMHLSESHFRTMARTATSISLSPIFTWLPQVQLVFHRTRVLGADWPSGSCPPLIRSGLDYAIVGGHCDRIPEDVYRHHLNSPTLAVAISMGGTDAANKTLEILATIKQIPEKLLLWILLGEGYAHSYQDLVDGMSGRQHEIILAKTNDSMWRILRICSVGIFAGGTSTYEAAFAGLPSVNTLETPEHVFLIQELVDRGVAVCAGTTFEESLVRVPELLRALNGDHQELLRMHRRSRGLIDGLGVKRVVDEIHQYCTQSAAQAL